MALLEYDLLAYSVLKLTTIVHPFIKSQQEILFPQRDELRKGFKRISFEIFEFFNNLVWRITGRRSFYSRGQPIEDIKGFSLPIVLGPVDDKGNSGGKWLNFYNKKFILIQGR